MIMDGNGRWAKQNALKRIFGHRKGADAVRNVVRCCREIGIKYLTLYAFSVENWRRPKSETDALMSLLERYIKSELKEMIDNDIRLTTIGDTGALPEGVRNILLDAIEKTAANKGMVLNLALSYGGRDEIVDAVKKILKSVESGEIAIDEINEHTFSRFLHTSGMPDPDFLIRTSGEYRLSNFLLWQAAYTELYFTNILWPDFSRDDLIDAIADYQRRERRYGLTSDQLSRMAKDSG